MTTPAARDHQSPLEVVLADVHATLADLLVAAEEQYAAVAARDRDRLESVTQQQERLAARLARAETRRTELLAGRPLSEAVSVLPAAEAVRVERLRSSIAAAVQELKQRQAQTAGLLRQSIALISQTLHFLQRLAGAEQPTYDGRGLSVPTRSLLVDGRA
jgi:flagellar biosynthesis/type III secretory pathway chaperone